jgi:hypothetical protein
MTVFGKSVSAYVGFAKGPAILMLLVGITRLAMSLGGVENATTKYVSLNITMLFCVIYLAIRMHTTGFGTYKHLWPAILVPSLVFHLCAILGIVIGMITGQDNIYTTPEYAFGQDGKTLLHLGAHLVIGIPVSTTINWLLGCLILLITRKLVRRPA